MTVLSVAAPPPLRPLQPPHLSPALCLLLQQQQQQQGPFSRLRCQPARVAALATTHMPMAGVAFPVSGPGAVQLLLVGLLCAMADGVASRLLWRSVRSWSTARLPLQSAWQQELVGSPCEVVEAAALQAALVVVMRQRLQERQQRAPADSPHSVMEEVVVSEAEQLLALVALIGWHSEAFEAAMCQAVAEAMQKQRQQREQQHAPACLQCFVGEEVVVVTGRPGPPQKTPTGLLCETETAAVAVDQKALAKVLRQSEQLEWLWKRQQTGAGSLC